MRKIINKRELSNTFQVSLSSASANYSVLRLPASRKDNLRNRPCHGKKYALLRFSMQQPATIIYIYIYKTVCFWQTHPPPRNFREPPALIVLLRSAKFGTVSNFSKGKINTNTDCQLSVYPSIHPYTYSTCFPNSRRHNISRSRLFPRPLDMPPPRRKIEDRDRVPARA